MLDNSGMEIISIANSQYNGEMAHRDKHPMLYFGNRTVTQIDVGYERSCALLDVVVFPVRRYSEYISNTVVSEVQDNISTRFDFHGTIT